MNRYVVLDRVADAPTVDARIVRDGFAFLGLLVPPLWLAWHGLWIAAVLVLAAEIVLAWFGPPYAGASIVIGLLVGLEGVSLRIAKARRKGLQEVAAIQADRQSDAELLYFGRETNAVETADPVTTTALPPPTDATARPILTGWRSGRSLLDTGTRR